MFPKAAKIFLPTSHRDAFNFVSNLRVRHFRFPCWRVRFSSPLILASPKGK
jgi:hypothetical protein